MPWLINTITNPAFLSIGDRNIIVNTMVSDAVVQVM